MGEVVWTGGQLVGLLGGAYLFYGFVAGAMEALRAEPAVAVVMTKDQFALVA
jgi:hypothetical protein